MARVGKFRPVERGYGPDNVPYEEALRREWAKQPPLPSSTGITGRNRRIKSAKAIALAPAKRYTDKPHIESPIREGVTTMPRTRATAPAVEPEETEETEADLTVYAAKTITPVAQALAEWLTEETGYDTDARSVYLTMSLRRRSRQDESVLERVEEIRGERKAAAEAAKPPKPVKAPPVENEEEGEAPAKPARRKPAAAAAVTSTSSTSKPAPARRRAAAAPAAGRTRAKAGATAPY